MKLTYSTLNFTPETSQILVNLMSEYSEFKCLGTVEGFDCSLNHIIKESPTIVFVDIDDPKIFDPFYFLLEAEQYMDKMPFFIAVSNSKVMAYNVIKSNFRDYILKPFLEFEVRKSIHKLKKDYTSKIQDKICLKSYSDYQFIELESILFLQADNNTTDFYLKRGGRVTAFKTLKHYELILPENFLRVHNSFLVNTDHIIRINFGKSLLSLDGGESKIPFSRSYKSEIEYLKSTLFDTHSLQA